METGTETYIIELEATLSEEGILTMSKKKDEIERKKPTANGVQITSGSLHEEEQVGLLSDVVY